MYDKWLKRILAKEINRDMIMTNTLYENEMTE